MGEREEGIRDVLERYLSSGPVRMHVPGHKGATASSTESLSDVLQMVRFYDVTEIADFDNLHYPVGVVRKSQEQAALLFGSEKTFFLVNGATSGILGALLAVRMTMGQGNVLLPRNIHRSVVSALVLSGLEPVFMYPEYCSELGGYLPVDSRCLESELLKTSNVKAALTVSPTYYGVSCDQQAVAALCHDRGVPLVVDEAHGSHFTFSEDLPESSLLSADIVVHGAHKTLPSLTQTGLLHITKSANIRFPRLRHNVEEALRLVQSSSPSYILMSSLEDALGRGQGLREWVRRGVDTGRALADLLSSIDGLTVGPSLSKRHRTLGMDLDPCRVLVNVSRLGITGVQAAGFLQRQGHVAAELSGYDHVLLVCTGGNTPSDINRVAQAFREMVPWARSRAKESVRGLGEPPRPERELGLRTSFFAPGRMVHLEQAKGMVSCDTIITYPPGVAIVLPGERLTAAVIDYIKGARRAGLFLAGRALETYEKEMMVFCVDA